MDRAFVVKEQERRDTAVAAGAEGDLSMYDRANLIKRRNLKSAPRIKGLIRQLWEVGGGEEGSWRGAEGCGR